MSLTLWIGYGLYDFGEGKILVGWQVTFNAGLEDATLVIVSYKGL